MNGKNVLVLAPHTDDGEIGAGGMISKLIEDGNEVSYVAFSIAEESVPEEFPKDILKIEVKLATNELGISDKNLIVKNYKVRNFNYSRQEILDDLINMKKEIKPDLVLMPSLNDIHQDHNVVASEGLRAFKACSILCYEVLWNNMSFNNQCFVKLEKRHIEKKIGAIKCYKSQAFRKYVNENFIYSLAEIRGMQIGVKFAEVFEVVRWVM